MSPTPAFLSNLGLVILFGLALFVGSLGSGAAATTMTEHGVSVVELQGAGTTAEAEHAREDLGQDGRRAAWWFLAFELPYLAGFGFLLSAGCAFAARRLAEVGAMTLADIAHRAVLLGLLAATCDLIQNFGVAFVLLGHTEQPAPGTAELFGYLTWVFGLAAGFVFVAGWSVAARRTRQATAK